MAIYALADLHLSLSNPEKSMDVFGSAWDGYIERIEKGWRETVTPEDTVLVAGDISWATYIEKAEEDFEFLASLPGRKLISRGNHDYWWTTIKKLDEFFAGHDYPGIEIVRTNVVEAEGCFISGTRGWMLESQLKTADDRKIYDREISRVKLCIEELEKADPGHAKQRILMIHYPPIMKGQEKTGFTELLAGHIDTCVYGHLHGRGKGQAWEGTDEGGVRYVCTAADYIDFAPVKITG
ncbi:MAG: metallophosphoesterase [Saccharofermentans sp.]|nr:metallophosphoesterase [Saccharofermentans sp.]